MREQQMQSIRMNEGFRVGKQHREDMAKDIKKIAADVKSLKKALDKCLKIPTINIPDEEAEAQGQGAGSKPPQHKGDDQAVPEDEQDDSIANTLQDTNSLCESDYSWKPSNETMSLGDKRSVAEAPNPPQVQTLT